MREFSRFRHGMRDTTAKRKEAEVLGTDELFMIITKNSREKRSREEGEVGSNEGPKQHHQTSIS
jgi:hypothetical protein